MNVIVDERLQAIASTKSSNAIQRAADVDYTFDVDDPYECGGLFEDGVTNGLQLAVLIMDKKKAAPDDDIKVFKITFSEYADDDGLAWFVGTEKSVEDLLNGLSSSDDDDDDLEYDDD